MKYSFSYHICTFPSDQSVMIISVEWTMDFYCDTKNDIYYEVSLRLVLCCSSGASENVNNDSINYLLINLTLYILSSGLCV